MPLRPGMRLGPYEVIAPIGSGGMGEVYRARDTQLHRDVALKVLPDEFASDPERLARFQREAQVLASLNHPNIAIIHGLEEADGLKALVLELVEGPTLADRIARGPIPLDEALPIARQIAEALEAAHEHGIIHRDLKPANIKARDDGTVKVLDFGLAKALDPVGRGFSPAAATDASQLPTITPLAATRMGVILGTAAYMSPEQATGKPVDKRTDIWAFGCVLYEMLTGQRAFEGEDVSDMLASILTKEPDWTALPPNAPTAIRRLVRRSVEKDRKRRLPDIAVARIEIDEALTVSPSLESGIAIPIPAPPQRLKLAIGAALGLGVGAIIAGTVVWLGIRSAPPRVTRLTITPPAAAPLLRLPGALAIAPDGTRLVYLGANGTLVVRALDQLVPTVLSGLGAPTNVFFSPDGQWIGFFDGVSTLKKVETSGGPAVTLCRLNGGSRGGTWGPDDTIIFATSDPSTGLLRVSASGGEPEVLTKPDQQKGEFDHFWPAFLPGGQAVLFTISTGPTENSQVAVLNLKTGTQEILVRGGSDAHYVPSGHLVYGVAGTLRAAAFDVNRLGLVGTPIPVLQEVMTTFFGGTNFDVASDGTLVYRRGGVQTATRTLVWVDRAGLEQVLKVPPRPFEQPRLSPDGRRLAITVREPPAVDVWVYELNRGTMTRLTFDPLEDETPVWTPDGQRIAFKSTRPGGLFWKPSDGSGDDQMFASFDQNAHLGSWSPDGRVLMISGGSSGGTGEDILMVAVAGNPTVRPFIQTPFDERAPMFSPDGRWLAYVSNETGRDEVYVRPFPGPGGKWQVSADGGTEPVWARSGRELYYRNGDRLLAVTAEPRPEFAAGAPQQLFRGDFAVGHRNHPNYDVSPDGQRFLMIKEAETDETSTPREIVVVQNWFEELKRLVPTR